MNQRILVVEIKTLDNPNLDNSQPTFGRLYP